MSDIGAMSGDAGPDKLISSVSISSSCSGGIPCHHDVTFHMYDESDIFRPSMTSLEIWVSFAYGPHLNETMQQHIQPQVQECINIIKRQSEEKQGQGQWSDEVRTYLEQVKQSAYLIAAITWYSLSVESRTLISIHVVEPLHVNPQDITIQNITYNMTFRIKINNNQQQITEKQQHAQQQARLTLMGTQKLHPHTQKFRIAMSDDDLNFSVIIPKSFSFPKIHC